MDLKKQPLLIVARVSKRFGETQALHDVSFDLNPGEVHCLVGENGAGKSTLIKILSGAEIADVGSIRLADETVSRLTPKTAMDYGIATIYQDVELIRSLTVAENIFLGRERRNRWGFIDFQRQERESRSLMDALDIAIPEAAVVETLSAADQQTLQIVKAMGRDARIMIMDEPTSSLGLNEANALMQLVRGLKRRGIGIIYISHHLEEVFEIGDRVTVLKDGQVVATDRIDATSPEEVTRSMVGRDATSFYQRQRVVLGDPILEVKQLSRHGLFSNCSFTLRRGEIFGLGGMVGSGRSELVRSIFGDLPPDSGHILLRGNAMEVSSPRESIELGVGFIGEDRHAMGMFTQRSVKENAVILKNEDRFFLNNRDDAESVASIDSRLPIAMSSADQRIGSLSGGNQQKAIIARWLLAPFDVLILDEPTKGVDVGAKAQIYELMVSLVSEGKAILLVSSDMPELISMSDRIGIMRGGNLVETVEAPDANEHDLLNTYLGIQQSKENQV